MVTRGPLFLGNGGTTHIPYQYMLAHHCQRQVLLRSAAGATSLHEPFSKSFVYASELESSGFR